MREKTHPNSTLKSKTSFRNINEQLLSLFEEGNDRKEFHNCFQRKKCTCVTTSKRNPSSPRTQTCKFL